MAVGASGVSASAVIHKTRTNSIELTLALLSPSNVGMLLLVLLLLNGAALSTGLVDDDMMEEADRRRGVEEGAVKPDVTARQAIRRGSDDDESRLVLATFTRAR